MVKKSIVQTIFREENSIERLQDWANEFLKTHEAVNLQVCKNESDLLQMMIVYKTEIEVEDDKSNIDDRAGTCETQRLQENH